MKVVNKGLLNLEDVWEFNDKVKTGGIEKIKEFRTSSHMPIVSKPLADLYMSIKGFFAGAEYVEIWTEGYSTPKIVGHHSYSGAFYRNSKK